MFSPTRIVGALCCVAVVACLLACGSVRQAAERQKRSDDLRTLGSAALNYEAANRTFPPDQPAFLKWAQGSGDLELIALIQQTGPGGQITFYYGPWKDADFDAGRSNTVLAHDGKLWPGHGRLVLTCDGSVQMKTDADLAAMPRPKSKK